MSEQSLAQRLGVRMLEAAAATVATAITVNVLRMSSNALKKKKESDEQPKAPPFEGVYHE